MESFGRNSYRDEAALRAARIFVVMWKRNLCVRSSNMLEKVV